MSYLVGLGLAKLIFRSTSALLRGTQFIPRSGRALLVCNHQSFLDPMLIALACSNREVHFLAKKELFRFPAAGLMLRAMGAIPVDRSGPSRQSLASVLKALRDDELVCLFAEGTRSTDGSLKEFQSGFAKIAIKTNCPVVPMALDGTRKLCEELQGSALPVWSQWIGSLPPQLRVGAPILGIKDSAELVVETRQTISQLLEECRAYESNGAP